MNAAATAQQNPRLKRGTKCRTKYEHDEVVTVIRPADINGEPRTGINGEKWYLVRYADGNRATMHQSMLVVVR